MLRILFRSASLAVFCLALLGSPLKGQTASLVRDLLPGINQNEFTSAPENLLSALGKVFFTTDDRRTGTEVWVSDGTASGTELLADSCKGECNREPLILGQGTSTVFWWVDSQLWRSDGSRKGTFPLHKPTLTVANNPFAFVHGILYFQGCTSQPESCGLWRSDGTEVGTRPVSPDSTAATHYIQNFQAVGDLIYFFININGEQGTHLWKTDGTAAGTVFIKRFDGYPRLTGVAGRRLFFVATPLEGEMRELWTSDGTAQGTLPLVSFPVSSLNSFPEIQWLKAIEDKIYFLADDVTHGREIWGSDGTPGGTTRVTSFGFHAPFQGLGSDQFETVGTKILYFATDGLEETKLWATETATGSMEPVADLCSESQAPCRPFKQRWTLRKVGGKAFFQRSDGQIWSSDGTRGGTRRLTNFCPDCGAVTSEPVASEGAVYFAVRKPTPSRNELWRSDGTLAGTRLFAPLGEELEIGQLDLVRVGGKVYFPVPERSGRKLWASDGTAEGTGKVANVHRLEEGSNPRALTPVGSRLFFSACPAEGPAWRSDGTSATTLALVSSPPDCDRMTNSFVSVGQQVFFFVQEFLSMQLWRTNEASAVTLKLTDFDLSETRVPGEIVPFKGKALFRVEDEIWQSDGSTGGTVKAFDLPVDAEEATAFTSFGPNFYFLSDHSLWRSDGTTQGTVRLTGPEDFLNPSAEDGAQFVPVGSNLLLITDQQLWRTDGTPAGTFQVPRDNPSFDFDIQGAVELGEELYFFGTESPIRKTGLWRWNGMREGAVLIRELNEFRSSNQRSFLTVFKGRLFFVTDDGIHGIELWQSNGTAEGTALVQDIVPGPDSSFPTGLTAVAGTLFFTADDAIHGREPWRSDGTAAGTKLVQDLYPGAASSSPQELTAVEDRLYFSADDGLSGRELWVLNTAEATGSCQPSSTTLCLGGRFKVEATWRDYEDRTGTGRAVGLTADTGYFWFFGPENVEVVVKVLNGQGVNGHFWVFYGALSNVEYSLTVTDTQTGLTRRYSNLLGRFASVGDTNGFGPLGAYSTKSTAPASPPALISERTDAAAATGTCVPGATRLCLNDGRFAVEATWKDFSGGSGTGKAVALTGDTGYFWFFDAANVEAVVKVLDGTPVNGKHWVFYGALSNVEYTLSVTDTLTGQVKTYKNPSGRFASVGDTGAF